MLAHQEPEHPSANESLLVLTAAVFLTMWFWLSLWLGGGLIGGDVYSYYFPQKTYYSACLQEGRIPLWNSLVGHGYPLLAESQTGVFYPFSLILYRYLDANTAYNVNHLLHYVLAFLGVYFVARTLGQSSWASGLGALGFVYGWFPARCCLEWAIVTGCYLPWAFLFLLRYFQTFHSLWLLGLSLLLFLQLLAGHFHLAFITHLVLIFWILREGVLQFRKRNTSSDAQVESASSDEMQAGRKWALTRIGLPLAAVAFAFGLAAVQLLPTWELTRHSQRSEGASTHFRPAEGHIPPRYLSQLVLPWLWYTEMSELNTELNRRGMLDYPASTNPVEAHLYIGFVPALLALIGILVLVRSREQTSSHDRWFLVMLLLSLLMSTGWLMPLLGDLPGFRFFRGVGRYGIVAAFALSLLAGRGWDALLASRSSWQTSLAAVAVGLITLIDLSIVSQHVTYAFMVDQTPITLRDQSPVKELVTRETSLPRLFAPGANLITVTGVASTPVYLGLGPAEYFDEQLMYPSTEPTDDPVQRFSAEQIQWLQKAGVTHVLGFVPPDPAVVELQLIWSGVDPFLNSAWGRQEPLFVSRLNGTRGRFALESPAPDDQIQCQAYSDQEIVLQVSTAQGGLLILTDLFDPDWQLMVDSGPAEMLRQDGMYRGVQIPPGQHEVRWSYAPWSYRAGKLVSGVFFTIWLGLLVTLLLSRKRHENPVNKG
ncbi:MAG: hypothetical protein KDA78_11285 [Planctomycetaceae bacterium]|nr:hypothetical protein [Planctomycetaceae bacterium]